MPFAQLQALRGSTIHRLLGRAAAPVPATSARSRNRLAHDLVVVDETSMVSFR